MVMNYDFVGGVDNPDLFSKLDKLFHVVGFVGMIRMLKSAVNDGTIEVDTSSLPRIMNGKLYWEGEIYVKVMTTDIGKTLKFVSQMVTISDPDEMHAIDGNIIRFWWD